MMVTVDIWRLLAAMGCLLSAMIAGGWVLIQIAAKQYDRRITERDKAREEADKKRDESTSKRSSELKQEIEKVATHQDDDIAELRRANARLEARINDLEKLVAAAPTKDDIVRLHERIDQLSADIAELGGSSKASFDTLQLIHRKLLGGNP